jgi:hypothetical protein
MYERILNGAMRTNDYPKNKSERFRLVLKVVAERVNVENMSTFYENLNV